MSGRLGSWAAAALMAAVVAGCSGSDDSGRTLVVFAASSLTDVFDGIAADFEAAHPDIDVVMNYGASSSLVAQLADGAPADVIATADLDTMARARVLVTFAADPVVFAENSLVIAVEAGNPLGVSDLADLANVPIVVLAAPEVPAGAYASEILDRAGVTVSVASYEPNVRSVVGKVALGEADAGLVYRTDIRPGSGVDGADGPQAIEIPPESNVVAEYPIAVVSNEPAAAEFVAFVTGARGAAALTAAGFVVP